MNAQTDDDRPPAIRHADFGADYWGCVTALQRRATPDHSHFYVLAGDIVETLSCLSSLSSLLAEQVAGYPGGRTLRDDEPGHDPIDRLAEACRHLQHLRGHLGEANHAANRFWSAIGHIAVEDTDEPEQGSDLPW